MSIAYTDIGHGDPNDVIWIVRGYDIEKIAAGFDRTHELIWGETATLNHWRGRYDVRTAFCSIAPPENSIMRRPPSALLEMLGREFSIVRFYFFKDGVQSITPNPRKRK